MEKKKRRLWNEDKGERVTKSQISIGFLFVFTRISPMDTSRSRCFYEYARWSFDTIVLTSIERIRTGIRICNLHISVARNCQFALSFFLPVELLAYLTLSRGTRTMTVTTSMTTMTTTGNELVTAPVRSQRTLNGRTSIQIDTFRFPIRLCFTVNSHWVVLLGLGRDRNRFFI